MTSCAKKDSVYLYSFVSEACVKGGNNIQTFYLNLKFSETFPTENTQNPIMYFRLMYQLNTHKT